MGRMTAKSGFSAADLSEGGNAHASWQEAHREAAAAGESHYRDPATGLIVFTEVGLRRRGSCCGSGCRHCPYHHEEVDLGERGRRAQRPTWLAAAGPPANRAVDVLFWSGGKDSLLACQRLLRAGARPIVLLTTFASATRRVAHQEVHIDSVIRQAEALGLPLLGVPLHAGDPVRPSTSRRLSSSCPAWPASSLGICTSSTFATGARPPLPTWHGREAPSCTFRLWGEPYEALVAELEASGVPCRVSAVTESVASTVEVGDSFDRELIGRLPKGVDAFGENGEFHTLAMVWRSEVCDRALSTGARTRVSSRISPSLA